MDNSTIIQSGQNIGSSITFICVVIKLKKKIDLTNYMNSLCVNNEQKIVGVFDFIGESSKKNTSTHEIPTDSAKEKKKIILVKDEMRSSGHNAHFYCDLG